MSFIHFIISPYNSHTHYQADAGARMARAHASLAGLKSMSTTVAADGIEDCRRCCGGHGYLACSGLPELSGNFLQQVTVEVRVRLVLMYLALPAGVMGLSSTRFLPSSHSHHTHTISLLHTIHHIPGRQCPPDAADGRLPPQELSPPGHAGARGARGGGRRGRQVLRRGWVGGC